jgi:lipoprotein
MKVFFHNTINPTNDNLNQTLHFAWYACRCIFCNTRKDKQENHGRYDREKERINMNIPETITCF